MLKLYFYITSNKDLFTNLLKFTWDDLRDNTTNLLTNTEFSNWLCVNSFLKNNKLIFH